MREIINMALFEVLMACCYLAAVWAFSLEIP